MELHPSGTDAAPVPCAPAPCAEAAAPAPCADNTAPGAAEHAAPGADAAAHLLMRQATELHKRGAVEPAIALYRRLLMGDGSHHQALILLAHLLWTAPSADARARRAEAAGLAERARALANTVPEPRDRALLLARYGYFVMQSQGLHAGRGDDDGDEGGAGAAAVDAGSPLGRAQAALERAVALDPAITIAWRNLSIVYKAQGRLDESEDAMARAVAAAGPLATGDLLYRHAKALRRLRREPHASLRYCDVLRVEPAHALSAFWLRVALAGGSAPLPPAALERVHAALHAFDSAAAAAAAAPGMAPSASGGGAADGPPPPVTSPATVPHEYISKLFDGYASKFDQHLLGQLGYQTPGALLALALDVAAAASRRPDAPSIDAPAGREEGVEGARSSDASGGAPAAAGAAGSAAATASPLLQWRRCGDLGCGTGLAGVEFRRHVRWLSGVDLSAGMVAEARRRTTSASTHSQGAAATPGNSGVTSMLDAATASGSGGTGLIGGAASAPAHPPPSPLYDSLDVDEVEAWLRKQAAVIRQAVAASADGDSAADAAAAAAARALGCTAAPAGPYDLLVCADVLVYIGALEGVFAAAAAAMRPTAREAARNAPPSLFLVSTESDMASEQDGSSGSGGTFRLTPTGRCCHARAYVEACARAAGFELLAVRRQPIRHNAGVAVVGDLFCFERREA